MVGDALNKLINCRFTDIGAPNISSLFIILFDTIYSSPFHNIFSLAKTNVNMFF
jgi:hypothetical protein